MPEPRTRPFWAQCRSCDHCWPAAHFPCDAAEFARAAAAKCPRCGTGQPTIPKQANGKLLEAVND